MVNILIATKNINIIKRLTNEIITNNYDIRIGKICNNNEEIIDILNNTNIDIIFLDLKMVGNSLNAMFEKLDNNKKGQYKDSIIIMSDTFNQIENISRNCMVVDYILQDADRDEIIYKINKVVEKKDIEIKRKAIIRELEYINYNTDYKGTNYLIDTILQVYRNKKLMMENLQKDVYPIISNIYKKSVNTIRCNIRRATECMYCECDIKKLNEYFGIIDDERPSTKDVIYTVLSKIS
ncbi:MAG: hypothetical protein HFJ20_00885 [Clostridia bacterium]|nr:hypothetical protein [Clostridia bacterium]